MIPLQDTKLSSYTTSKNKEASDNIFISPQKKMEVEVWLSMHQAPSVLLVPLA